MAVFLFQGVVAIIQLVLFFIIFSHETPYWLLSKCFKEKALESIATTYKRNYAEQFIESMASTPSISSSPILADSKINYDYIYTEIFTCAKGTTKAMRLGLLLNIIQQFAELMLFYHMLQRFLENLVEVYSWQELLQCFQE